MRETVVREVAEEVGVNLDPARLEYLASSRQAPETSPTTRCRVQFIPMARPQSQ